MSSSSSFRVLLLICGGIAAYKSLLLIRLLRKNGIEVRCVMTSSAAQFVTPLSVASLSGDNVYSELFSLTDESEMGHIELSRQADLVVVAPATANMIAKMAHGIADNLASTILMATNKPVLVVPSMNVRMWEHAATQRNIAQLLLDGISLLGPEQGDMACGEFGYGRMVEPESIAAWVENYRSSQKKLILIIGSIPYQNEDGSLRIPDLIVEDFSILWSQICSLGICVDVWAGVSSQLISIPHIRIQNREHLIQLYARQRSAYVFSLAQWPTSIPEGIHDLCNIEDRFSFVQSLIAETP